MPGIFSISFWAKIAPGTVPAAPAKMMDTRPNRPQVIQSCDVFVDAQGIIYSTDYNGGLSVIEYLG